MKGDWQRMIKYCQEHFEKIHCPVTPFKDTVLRLAVNSKDEKPLKYLLEIMKERSLPKAFLKTKNKFGNTAIHEATIYSNHETARLLAERRQDLLIEKNEYGETPLFTAA